MANYNAKKAVIMRSLNVKTHIESNALSIEFERLRFEYGCTVISTTYIYT